MLRKSTKSKKCCKFPIATYWFFLSYLLSATWDGFNVRWSLHTAGIRRCGDYAPWWAGPCSLPAAVHGKNVIPGLHHTSSTSLLLEVDVVWIGRVLLPGPTLWHSILDFHTPTLLPNFFHEQNMKQCGSSGWCWARQMSLQILAQRVQSPLCISHLTVHCWGHDGTGKQGPLWLTWQCRR